MKKFIFILFLLFTLFPASAVKRIEANPLCVSVALTEQVDTASLAKTCEFYGYHQVESSSALSASLASPRGQTASADTSYSILNTSILHA